MDLAPDPEVLEALAASIPLTFVVRTRGSGLAQRIPVTLSYAPLLDRYELQTPQNVRSFRLRAELLDAFESLRGLPAAAGVRQVRVALDLAALPTPLHLPAWFSEAWDLDSGWQAVSLGELSRQEPAP